MDKKEAEELKNKLFNKKENGWNSKTAEQKQEIFDYAKGYIDYMNKSKTEREIISTSTEIAHQNGWIDKKQLKKLGEECGKTAYGQYIIKIAEEEWKNTIIS